MIENHAPWPIEYDEMNKSWKVKLKSREIKCDTEREARLISNIPCLYKELEDKPSPYDDYLIQRLQQTVEIIKNYHINCWASRKLLAIYEKIPQKSEW